MFYLLHVLLPRCSFMYQLSVVIHDCISNLWQVFKCMNDLFRKHFGFAKRNKKTIFPVRDPGPVCRDVGDEGKTAAGDCFKKR